MRPSLQRRWLLSVSLLGALILSACAQDFGAATQSWSGIAPGEDVTYVATREGRVIQLDIETGVAEISPFRAEQLPDGQISPAFYGTPNVVGDQVYVGGYHGVVYSLDAATLQQTARFEIPGNELAKGIAGEVVAAEGALVVLAAEDANEGRMYVLEADGLVERCRYPSRGEDPIGQVWSSALVHNGVAYFGDLAQRVHAVSISNCSPVWDVPADLKGAVIATPIVVGDKLYVGAFNRSFYAIDIATGGLSSLFEADSWFWGTAATDGSRIYAPNMDGHIYAYDIRENRVVWSYPETGDSEPIISAPVVVGDQLVFGSDDGSLTILRTQDGAFEWDRRVGNDIRAPLRLSGTVVFAHSLDENVVAIDIETKRLVWDRSLNDVP